MDLLKTSLSRHNRNFAERAERRKGEQPIR